MPGHSSTWEVHKDPAGSLITMVPPVPASEKPHTSLNPDSPVPFGKDHLKPLATGDRGGFFEPWTICVADDSSSLW